ncbi:MAG: hypothetical protein ACFFCS_21180 [Candidatus Hodarchaeota archaeon]
MKDSLKKQALFILSFVTLSSIFLISTCIKDDYKEPLLLGNDQVVDTSGSSKITYIDGPNNVSVYIPNTTIDRLNRIVNISVNISNMVDTFYDDHIGCYLNVTFPNSSVYQINMNENQTIPSQDVFYYEFKTNTSMETGVYNFTPHPVNDAGNNYYNFTITSANDSIITIHNVEPWALFQFNSTDIYRNETLGFNFTLFDGETPYVDLDWNVSLWKVDSDSPLIKIEYKDSWATGDDFNQTWTSSGIENETLGVYRFFAEIDDTEMVATDVSDTFQVLNRLPIIEDSNINAGAETLRETDIIEFEVNASDYEDGENISKVQVVFQSDFFGLNITPYFDLEQDSGTKNWTGNYSFPITTELGEYNIILKAIDQNGGESDWVSNDVTSTEVMNNLPITHGATVNDQSLSQGRFFKQSENLIFEINVSDVEDGKNVEFGELRLYHQETGKNIFFLMAPRPADDRIIIEIASSFLETGTWNVYIAVMDQDGDWNYDETGEITNLVGAIEIEPDLSNITATVVMIILAAIIGFAVGGFVLWRRANSKIKDIRSEILIKGKGKEKPLGKGKEKTRKTYVEPPADEPVAGKKAIKKEEPKKQPTSKKSRKTKKRF